MREGGEARLGGEVWNGGERGCKANREVEVA